MYHNAPLPTALYFRFKFITTPRRISLSVAALFATAVLLWLANIRGHQLVLSRPFGSQNRPSSIELYASTLGVASKMYMLTLPARKDRRLRMETLREALGLEWTYIDGLQSTNELTQEIWEWVVRVRDGQPTIINDIESRDGDLPPTSIGFAWPKDIDQLALSSVPIDFWGETVWSTPATVHNPTPYHPTVCAMDNYRILGFTPELPEHLVLTRARIACWYSHISIIHSIANNKESDLDSTFIIFEDDIDMEKDTAERLNTLWSSLPQDWDMVFLGHCWSDEKKNPPLPVMLTEPVKVGLVKASSQNTTLTIHRLHPSNQPKCTHAYAVSKRGARRLLLYLRYPPFAYSRAVDQAFSWLIEIGRINSYTVVPSLVVQTKEDVSDISFGTGGGWPERLLDGVLTGSHPVRERE